MPNKQEVEGMWPIKRKGEMVAIVWRDIPGRKTLIFKLEEASPDEIAELMAEQTA